MKCRICGYELNKDENSHKCCSCGSNCSKVTCPNCGYQNLPDSIQINLKPFASAKSRIKGIKSRITKL